MEIVTGSDTFFHRKRDFVKGAEDAASAIKRDMAAQEPLNAPIPPKSPKVVSSVPRVNSSVEPKPTRRMAGVDDGAKVVHTELSPEASKAIDNADTESVGSNQRHDESATERANLRTSVEHRIKQSEDAIKASGTTNSEREMNHITKGLLQYQAGVEEANKRFNESKSSIYQHFSDVEHSREMQSLISKHGTELDNLREKLSEHLGNFRPHGSETDNERRRRQDENSRIIAALQESKEKCIREGIRLFGPKHRQNTHDRSPEKDDNAAEQAQLAESNLPGLRSDLNAKSSDELLETDILADDEHNTRNGIDSWDRQVRNAFFKHLSDTPVPYGTTPTDEINDAMNLIVTRFDMEPTVESLSSNDMCEFVKILLRKLSQSVYFKMAFVAEDDELFKKYFPRDRYQEHYRSGHQRIAAKIREKVPALKKVQSVSRRHLETIGEIASAMIMGVTQGGPGMFENATVRVSTISLLIDTWKGTDETGVEVIENEIHDYVADFPRWAGLVDAKSSYFKLLSLYEPRGARAVKHWAHEFVTPKTSGNELIKLIKTSLVPKLQSLAVARVDPQTVTSAEVHAGFLRIMKANNCHDAFYPVSKHSDIKAAHMDAEHPPRMNASSRGHKSQRFGDELARKIIGIAKDLGTCWNCLQKGHATRDCPRISNPRTNIAAIIMADYTSDTMRGRSAAQEKISQYWNKDLS